MNENNMQHGVDWDGQDITGWIATEKYNGCRAYWDGENLWSRGGIKIMIPDHWRINLPPGVHLDGEIYDGVDGVYRCGSAIRYGRFTPSMRFVVFDCPSASSFNFISRMQYVANTYVNPVLFPAPWWEIRSLEHAKDLLKDIQKCGGEGLMLRHPDIGYRPGRTADLRKFKGGWIDHV